MDRFFLALKRFFVVISALILGWTAFVLHDYEPYYAARISSKGLKNHVPEAVLSVTKKCEEDTEEFIKFNAKLYLTDKSFTIFLCLETAYFEKDGSRMVLVRPGESSDVYGDVRTSQAVTDYVNKTFSKIQASPTLTEQILADKNAKRSSEITKYWRIAFLVVAALFAFAYAMQWVFSAFKKPAGQ